jgi:hypothetical protein
LCSSRWCGLNPGEAGGLFDMGFVRDFDPADFIASGPITRPYSRFGIRDFGHTHIGVGMETADDCLDLYLTEFQ